MPERRSASRLQGVPDPRDGIDAGGARGPGVTLYEPFHRALLGAEGLFDLDHILAVTRSVSLDAERLVRAMEDPSLDALIERNAILANALGVRGTPAFVIGVVERPLLTLRNAARSMDYRADRHRTYAPINTWLALKRLDMVALYPSGPAALDAPPTVALKDSPAHGGPAAGIQVGMVSAHVLLFLTTS